MPMRWFSTKCNNSRESAALCVTRPWLRYYSTLVPCTPRFVKNLLSLTVNDRQQTGTESTEPKISSRGIHADTNGNTNRVRRARKYFPANLAAAPSHLFRFAGSAFAQSWRTLRRYSDPRLQRRDGLGRQAHHGVCDQRA